jgi:hypothetical protein
MEETKHIQIKDFNYELPEERIAKFPLPERDQSKLLVYRHGTVGEDTFVAGLFAPRCPDGIQQHESHTGAVAFPQRYRRAHRGVLSGTDPSA